MFVHSLVVVISSDVMTAVEDKCTGTLVKSTFLYQSLTSSCGTRGEYLKKQNKTLININRLSVFSFVKQQVINY